MISENELMIAAALLKATVSAMEILAKAVYFIRMVK